MITKYKSYNTAETVSIAAEFAQKLTHDDVVCINGDLGAGKTAFVQGLANALGVKGYISSPTFTIVNEYNGRLPIFHFDVYRISDCDEMYEIGYDDYIYAGGICIIEWADNIAAILPENRYEITIAKNYDKGEEYRDILIEKRGQQK